MTDPVEDYTKWIGQGEVLEDDISLDPALAAAAALDDTVTRFGKGTALCLRSGTGSTSCPRRPNPCSAATSTRSVAASCRRSLILGACSLGRICAFIDRSSSVSQHAARA